MPGPILIDLRSATAVMSTQDDPDVAQGRVLPKATAHRIVAQSANQFVITIATVDRIVAALSPKSIVARAAEQDVISADAIDIVPKLDIANGGDKGRRVLLPPSIW